MPKRFELKEKAWSLDSSYLIRDELDQIIYLVDGKFFSWGKDLSFRDYKTGQELFQIKRRLFCLFPQFEIKQRGEVIAEFRKQFYLWGHCFRLRFSGGATYQVEAGFWSRNFIVSANEKQLAKLSKKFWAWTDTYSIEIYEGDEQLILAAAIILDCVLFNHGSD